MIYGDVTFAGREPGEIKENYKEEETGVSRKFIFLISIYQSSTPQLYSVFGCVGWTGRK